LLALGILLHSNGWFLLGPSVFLLPSLPRVWVCLRLLFPSAIATAGLAWDYIFGSSAESVGDFEIADDVMSDAVAECSLFV
jgi:hypothetical protein